MPRTSLTDPVSSTPPSLELPISLQYRRGKKSLQKELAHRILHSDLFETAAHKLPAVILWDNARDLNPQQKLALLKRVPVPRMPGLQNRAGLPYLYRHALLHNEEEQAKLIRQSMGKENENCNPEPVEQSVRAMKERNSSLDEALIHSATHGQIEQLEQIVKLGANLETTAPETHRTALQIAASRGDMDAVLCLVRAGANVNAGLNEYGQPYSSPVFLAIEQGHVDVVIHLLEFGAFDIADGHSVLHYAARCGHAPIVLALLDYGYEINQLGFIGTTPLHQAASGGYVDLLKIMVQRGADPKLKDQIGYAALHHAVESQNIPSIEFLVHTAGLLDKDGNRTPLHVATSERPNLEIVDLLIRFGCDVNARDKHGETPLLNVVSSLDGNPDQYLAIVQRLLQLGAQVNVANDYGTTPLHHAVQEGGNAVAELFFARGANPHAVDHEGLSPLHHASSFANIPMIEALIQREVDVNARDRLNRTPLYYAVEMCTQTGDPRQIRCLLEAGADPLLKDNEEMTPLHYAAAADCIESIHALIHGKSPAELHTMLSQKNEGGETPFDLATSNEARDLLEIQEVVPCEDDDQNH